jgi:hypothetical protein
MWNFTEWERNYSSGYFEYIDYLYSIKPKQLYYFYW